MISQKGIWPIDVVTVWFESNDRIRKLFPGHGRVHVYSYDSLALPGFSLYKEKLTPVIPIDGKKAEEVLSTFRDTTRNEVRRTFKMPELTFSLEKAGPEHYAFYVAATRTQGRVPQRAGLFLDALVSVARSKGLIIAAISFVPARPIAKVLTISSLRRESVSAEERNLIGFSTKRLVYEICLFGIHNKYEGVDLGYVNLSDPAKRGISDFKMGFGGAVRTERQYVKESRLMSVLRRIRPI